MYIYIYIYIYKYVYICRCIYIYGDIHVYQKIIFLARVNCLGPFRKLIGILCTAASVLQLSSSCLCQHWIQLFSGVGGVGPDLCRARIRAVREGVRFTLDRFPV